MRSNSFFNCAYFIAFLTFWVGIGTVSSFAQTGSVYGNEWINYSQSYYKIKVAKNGMHRLSYTDLVAAGISNVNPQKFQLFRRGQEVAIYVNGQADGVLNNGDYIDFYGQSNDGKLDNGLYRNASLQVHSYYSLFTDTASYYLTWGTANGKRMQERTSQTSGLTPEPRHYAERIKLLNDQYFAGYRQGSTQSALGESGEGFSSPSFPRSRKDTISNVTNIENTGRNPTLEVALISANVANAQVKVLIKPPVGPERVLTNATTGSSGELAFPAFSFRRPKFTIQHSDIHPNGAVYIRAANVDSLNSTLTRQTRVAYYKLTYSRNNDLGNSEHIIFTDSVKTSATYLAFTNPPANAIAYDITDPYNVIRTEGVNTGSQKGFVFDPSINKRKVLIANSQLSGSPASVTSVQFQQITNPAQLDYVIIAHSLLHAPVTGTSYLDPPADYAAYRASAQGGNYKPVVIDIEQVYEQFHYGEKSSMAVRNFMNWFMANGDPKFLLLMGKALEIGINNGDIRKRPKYYKDLGDGEELIPTFGWPGSDVLFTADWKNNSYSPLVATGRISASEPADITDYLDKVKAHDALGVEEWRKNILHLGGGNDASEQQQFKRYLENYRNKVEGPFLGGKVKSIFRANNGQTTISLNVKDEVNAGLSLITFFGHSSTNTSDLDIGMVSSPVNGYSNLNKYPMILMNGCGAGNAFQLRGGFPNFSFSEDWLMAPNKGCVLFLGSVNNAVPFALNSYSNNFYSVAFSDSAYYGKPIGEIQQEVIDRVIKNSSTNWDYQVVTTEMVLQGDPAVRLFAPEKPDYTFKTNALALESVPKGSKVTASDEKFNLVINAKNLGKAIEDSLIISVKRTLPNGSVIQYKPIKFPPLYSETTYLYSINNKGVIGFGDNKFEVTLDAGNKVDELSETNNTAVLNQYLSVNGVIALAPTEYGIVSTGSVKLMGQPANLLTPARDYYFEIDTVNTFNSPVKQSSIVRNAKTTPSWQVNLFNAMAPKDSLVFFWRLRFNTFGPAEDTIWAESSFRYIGNSPNGWSQSHHSQFSKAQKDNIQINQANRKWEFAPIYKSLTLRTIGGNHSFGLPYGIYVENNMTFNFCHSAATPVITVGIYNNLTLETYMGFPTNQCGHPRTFYVFNFSSAADIANFNNLIQSIPDGYYVAVLSGVSVPFTTLTPAQKAGFKLVGSSMIDTLKTGYPFALVGQKGATAAQSILLQEKTYDPALATNPLDQAIILNQNITGKGTEGKITSTKIGPASQWTTLHHTVKASGTDDYTLDLYGFDLKGNRTLVQANVQSNVYSLASVSAQTFPYLQLEMAKKDSANRTAPQLKQWMVVYQPVPEGIMRPDLVGLEKYENISKQAAKGNIKMRFAFSNISGIPFQDSLTVVRSVTGSKVLQDTIMVKKLLVGDSVFFDYEFSTAGMKGNNSIRVNVNPEILPEQYYFNNFLEIPFSMPQADLHPVLDVAFDGVHIMDGDIVSPSPKIAINLKDEDRFDYVKDPSKLEVFLSKPNELTNFERVDLTNTGLVTLPDSTDVNRDKRDFKVIFHPKNMADGLYSLRVQGSDNSDQEAGFQPYTINFRVVNESSITHFYPYPNPFSSNTRFVFTLTGNPENMPRNLKIQIMTITGKVVREIQKEELGPIHVGNNMSLPWDGTDEFGDKLANGAYLYRVVMEKPPLEEMKHRKTSADKAFKKEYGKLYILR